MTKNACKGLKDIVGHIFDNLMWYLIYLMPLILLGIYSCKTGITDLSTIMHMAGLDIVADNVVLTTITAVFGTGGVLPIFQQPSLLIYLSYFICVNLIHLIVDILLWIVRACHRLVNHGFGGASHE